MSTLSMLMWRARQLNINGETSASPADLTSVFPASLFLESAGWPRVKMNEYMIYQVWKAMEEDEKNYFVSARYVLETLPCLAGVSLRKVQEVMAILRKKKKNGQPPPQPPRPLLFSETHRAPASQTLVVF